MPKSVYQIIYTSKTDAELSDASLEAILTQAQKNNSAQGMTGILLYECKEFLQVLEGDKDKVKAALNRITSDPRHKNVLLMYDRFVARRAFAKWEMGFAKLDTSAHSNLEQLNGFFEDDHDYSHLQSGLIRVFLTGFLLGRSTSMSLHQSN